MNPDLDNDLPPPEKINEDELLLTHHRKILQEVEPIYDPTDAGTKDARDMARTAEDEKKKPRPSGGE